MEIKICHNDIKAYHLKILWVAMFNYISVFKGNSNSSRFTAETNVNNILEIL